MTPPDSPFRTPLFRRLAMIPIFFGPIVRDITAQRV
jgi:hypothetical protein